MASSGRLKAVTKENSYPFQAIKPGTSLVILLRDVDLSSMILFVQDTGIRITIPKKPARERKKGRLETHFRSVIFYCFIIRKLFFYDVTFSVCGRNHVEVVQVIISLPLSNLPITYKDRCNAGHHLFTCCLQKCSVITGDS